MVLINKYRYKFYFLKIYDEMGWNVNYNVLGNYRLCELKPILTEK